MFFTDLNFLSIDSGGKRIFQFFVLAMVPEIRNGDNDDDGGKQEQ